MWQSLVDASPAPPWERQPLALWDLGPVGFLNSSRACGGAAAGAHQLVEIGNEALRHLPDLEAVRPDFRDRRHLGRGAGDEHLLGGGELLRHDRALNHGDTGFTSE